jgi:diguanylate cyclase (GGDEF)-like protein
MAVHRVRIARRLFTVLAGAGIVYCLVALFLPSPSLVIPVVLGGVVATFFLRTLADRGRVEVAVLLLLLSLSLMLILAVAVGGAIGATPMYLPLLVAVAGASLYPRQVVWAVLGAVVVLLVMNLVGSEVQQPTSAGYMLTYALVVTVLVGVVSWVSARSVGDALSTAVQEQQRAERLAGELEERVTERTRALELALERQRELAAELEELSVRDPLTGLHNRRRIDDDLDRMFADAHRSGIPLSVAMIDLDDFKSVNDRFTHLVGDDVLRFAAGVLTSSTRAADVLVRMGGEEFALLMPGTSALDGLRVCERMRTELEGYPWDALMPGLQVTASFGLSCSTDHDSAADLVRTADERLIRAKREGKNRIEVS